MIYFLYLYLLYMVYLYNWKLVSSPHKLHLINRKITILRKFCETLCARARVRVCVCTCVRARAWMCE